ncbi:MAG TPA: PPC domain-containing protein [Burkholderiales bacterium]|nr:PPC domain-containing protein [Burkholderiales bacterium]
MKKIGIVRGMIAGALMSAYVGGAAAQLVCPSPRECEPNYPTAQPIAAGADGKMVVNGRIGALSGAAISDQDLYSFYARKGEVLDIDIDDGIKFGTGRSVQTTLTVLGPSPAFRVERQAMMSTLSEIDEGSVSIFDPYISQFKVPADGIYVVGVTGASQTLMHGGQWTGSISPFNGNGNYTLIISVTPALEELLLINIQVKPGSGEFAPINLKSKGSIPVALISSDDFEALKVDRDSLTFGATGDESSLRKCAWEGEDVGGDSKLDLVCHFENQKTGFGPDNLDGTLKGTIDGKPFKGSGALKVIPAKKDK